MVDVNIPREQACTQHNALNTQRNMRSGQSGWAKHTQHSSIRKTNMASTGFYLFLSLFLLSSWKNRSEMMHGEQQMCVDKLISIPAGRPASGDRSELLSTTQRAWHNRAFISVSTDRFALQLARRPTSHSVWAEISKGNRSMTVSPTLTNKIYLKWNQSDYEL